MPGWKEAKIAYGRLSNLDDLVAHPQNHWMTVDTGQGELELLSPAAVVKGEVPSYGPVPQLDEHGKTLRDEFG